MAQHDSGGTPPLTQSDWAFIQASEHLVEALHAYVVALYAERGQSSSALLLSERLCIVGEEVCAHVADLLLWRNMLEDEPAFPPPQPTRPVLRVVYSAD
jgi:hypothetical protein